MDKPSLSGSKPVKRLSFSPTGLTPQAKASKTRVSGRQEGSRFTGINCSIFVLINMWAWCLCYNVYACSLLVSLFTLLFIPLSVLLHLVLADLLPFR